MSLAQNGMPEDVWTPDDVAMYLKVPKRTIVQLRAQGRLPGAFKVGRRWRLARAAIERMVADAGMSRARDEATRGPPHEDARAPRRTVAGGQRSSGSSGLTRAQRIALLNR
jgi:excisionase family DNA binding protein